MFIVTRPNCAIFELLANKKAFPEAIRGIPSKYPTGKIAICES